MWKLRLIVIISLNSIFQVFAQQVYFDFENGEIDNWHKSHSEHWCTDTINPIMGKVSLHHCYDNQEAGFDAISFKYDILQLKDENAAFEFALRYDYRPSSSNNWVVWLVAENNASNMHPDAQNTGYLIGVNYTGSDDYLKLWRKQNGKIFEILNTKLNWQESFETGSLVWIKVTKSKSGLWTVFYSLASGSSWQTIGSATDTLIQSGAHMGIYYHYSSSQDQKLWLDEISISGKFIIDNEPPNVSSYKITSQRSVEITFSEPIDTAYAEDVIRLNKKYFPVEKHWKSNQVLAIAFDYGFDKQNELELFGFMDLSGNSSKLIHVYFNYYLAEKYDVIISEIMADPTPSSGLPESEYLELLNTSNQKINLYKWELLIGEDTITLPEYIIEPGRYVMICNQKSITHFSDTIKKLGLSGFPALQNSGELIQLISNNNVLIHAVHYSQDMYKSTAKQEGGWSLEIIDINKACMDKENWSECRDILGGTPGKANSVEGYLNDTLKPFIERIVLLDAQHLELLFSENIDESSVSIIDNYQCDDVKFMDSVFIYHPYNNRIILTLTDKLNDHYTHKLYLKPELTDCSGNSFKNEEYYFGIPQIPDSSDVVINEILFESSDSIPEFIELYNNSQKIIDLKNFSIGFYDDFSESYSKHLMFSKINLYIFPGDYLTITTNKELLADFYSIDVLRNILQPEKWQNLSNEGGKIGLFTPSGSVIDEAYYEKEMHFEMLNKTAGVSLERIAYSVSGLDKNNWHSASSNSNYASPCKQNSQYFLLNRNKNDFIIKPEEISPDNDGDNDYLSISYQFDKPGYLISIYIYNTQGMLVTKIANNEMCGFNGSYFWEGIDDNGNKLPFGYYIVYCSAMHPQGYKKVEKKSILVLP